MNTKDLKEYLGMVVDIEANVFLLEEMRDNIKNKIACISDPQPRKLTPPQKTILTPPEKPKGIVGEKIDDDFQKISISMLLNVFLPYALLGFLVGIMVILIPPFVFWMTLAFIFVPLDLFIELLSAGGVVGASAILPTAMDSLASIFAWSLKFTGIPGAIVGSIIGCGKLKEYQQTKAKNQADIREYNRKLLKYKQDCDENEHSYEVLMGRYFSDCKEEEERVQTARQVCEKKRSFLRSTINNLTGSIREASVCLNRIYDVGVIFPKYRNFIDVCSLYEYICSGRCSTLDGRDGAYNILEAEKRADCIITQMDLVLEQLNAIRRNQYQLYTAIQSNKEKMNRILASNQRILERLDVEGDYDAKSSEIDSYCEELSQKEKEYERRINDFR